MKDKKKPTNWAYRLTWVFNVIIFFSVVPIWSFALWLSLKFRGEVGFVLVLMTLAITLILAIIDSAIYNSEGVHLLSNVLNALKPKDNTND